MGIQDRWLQFKLSQERHQWLNIRHPILLCQLYHTHPQPGTNHPHPFFSVPKNSGMTQCKLKVYQSSTQTTTQQQNL
jgi:hypothetical protein